MPVVIAKDSPFLCGIDGRDSFAKVLECTRGFVHPNHEYRDEFDSYNIHLNNEPSGFSTAT